MRNAKKAEIVNFFNFIACIFLMLWFSAQLADPKALYLITQVSYLEVLAGFGLLLVVNISISDLKAAKKQLRIFLLTHFEQKIQHIKGNGIIVVRHR